jgi:hypothetical protein
MEGDTIRATRRMGSGAFTLNLWILRELQQAWQRLQVARSRDGASSRPCSGKIARRHLHSAWSLRHSPMRKMRRPPFHWKSDCGERKEKEKYMFLLQFSWDLSVYFFFSFPFFVVFLAKALIYALSSVDPQYSPRFWLVCWCASDFPNCESVNGMV